MGVGDDIIESEVDAPESEEQPGHDEKVGHISENTLIERRFAFSTLLARSFADDQVGGDEC